MGMDEDDDADRDYYSDHSDGPHYRVAADIDMWEIPEALRKLTLFDGDPYLKLQATNLGMIDRWLIDVEAEVLIQLVAQEHTPMEANFLSAQTQMWVFAAYEVMRTWRQRAKDVLKLAANGGLHLKINSLEEELGYFHPGRQIRANQLRQVQDDPSKAAKIEADLRRTHVTFARLEALRVSMAKHEVRGNENMIAIAPGYGRIDSWTGSLKYELGSGEMILDYVSRRDIADSIRAIDHESEPPTLETLREFDNFMKGKVE
jgi:hypothetical protein